MHGAQAAPSLYQHSSELPSSIHAQAQHPAAAAAAAAAALSRGETDMNDDSQQQWQALQPRSGFTTVPSFSSSSVNSSNSSLADLSLTSTMSCSSATSYLSGDDDASLSYSRPASSLDDPNHLVMMALDKYTLTNKFSTPHHKSPTSPLQPYLSSTMSGIEDSPHRQQVVSISSLGLDLGSQLDNDLLQQHRHSIAVSSTHGCGGSPNATHLPGSLSVQRANSDASTTRLTAPGRVVRSPAPAHVDSRQPTGLQASLQRFKISLPPISMPEVTLSSRIATVPLTPGGSLFFGARDGAANDIPRSPFDPPTPLYQGGTLPAAFEQRLAAEGGILGAAYAQQHLQMPPAQALGQQQTGPHRNRIQQKRASLPHVLGTMSRPSSGSLRSSPMPRSSARSGQQGSASPRSASPLASSLESTMTRVAMPSMSISSQSALQSQAHSIELHAPSRTSGPSMGSSASSSNSSSSSASALAPPSLLTPPYSPMNLSGLEEAALFIDAAVGSATGRSGSHASTPRMTTVRTAMASTQHDADVVVPVVSTSATHNQPLQTVQPCAAPSHVEAPMSQSHQGSRSPEPRSDLHLQVDLPTAEEIQAIRKQSARSALSSTAMIKSASAPTPSAQTVSGRCLAHHQLHPVFAATYTLGDELGSGGFGFVVAALRNSDNFPVAVKFIWKEKVPSQGWVRDRDLGVVPMEVFVLKTVQHPSIVRFVDLFDDDQFFYLVMEHHGSPWKAPPPKKDVLKPSTQANDGAAVKAGHNTKDDKALQPPAPAPMERRSSCDLFECIEQHSRLNEEQARWVFAQVVEAVYYLDSLGITHRDIKDENCVVDADFNVKLIDFGSAVVSDPRAPAPYFNRFYGTMTFASAEILQGKLYRAPQAEVWSLGVLLSILLSGECPFSDPSAAIKGRISKPKGMWTAQSLELMMRCLDVDPNRRATVAEVRENPWVRRAWELRGLQRPT